jgi:hypothetical protein
MPAAPNETVLMKSRLLVNMKISSLMFVVF